MEEQTIGFNFPVTRRSKGQIQTSVLVSQGFYELAHKYNIKFSEALRVGLSLMFAEIGEIEYDNKLNIFRKMTSLRTQLETTSKELEQLKDKLNINDVFNA